VPLSKAQTVVEPGVQICTTHTPSTKEYPAWQPLIWQAPQALPLLLQVLNPEPAPSEHGVMVLGSQVFATQVSEFSLLKPGLQSPKVQAE
jgi:hypothetical protein